MIRERRLSRLAPEDDPLCTHRAEGPDDMMPAHLQATLTGLTPIVDARLALGAWQGIYLWEHRRHGGAREVIARIGV